MSTPTINTLSPNALARAARTSLLLAGFVVASAAPAAVASHHSNVIQTEAGAIEGEAEGAARVYRGIPFAAPPVGQLRFRPPAPAKHWQGIKPALDFMPACAQLVERDPTENNNSVMSEDCLGLNVWAPATGHGPWPVMVFIHGGAFIEGSARNSWYDGAALAMRGVVLVSLQYRLGVFGFLELGEIGGDGYRESGNLGILDQVAALKWVQRNIAAFGGDPHNVTVFGESVGATSIGILLTLPEANGLFHKAILESNSGTRIGHDKASATTMARDYMRTAGAKSVDDLKRMNWREMRNAQGRLFETTFGDSSFGPTWDGVVIQGPPFSALQAGRSLKIPLMIGTNLDEVRYWSTIEDLPLTSRPREQLIRQVGTFAGTHAADIVATYERLNPGYGDALVQLMTDALWRMASIRVAESLCARQPVYMYRFSYRSTAPDAEYGAAHAMELPFVFGGLDAQDVIAFTGRSPARTDLSQQMQTAWVDFARTGSPGSAGHGPWPRYDLTERATMDFGTTTHVIKDPGGEERRAWEGVPFNNTVPSAAAATALLSGSPPAER